MVARVHISNAIEENGFVHFELVNGIMQKQQIVRRKSGTWNKSYAKCTMLTSNDNDTDGVCLTSKKCTRFNICSSFPTERKKKNKCIYVIVLFSQRSFSHTFVALARSYLLLLSFYVFFLFCSANLDRNPNTYAYLTKSHEK